MAQKSTMPARSRWPARRVISKKLTKTSPVMRLGIATDLMFIFSTTPAVRCGGKAFLGP